jgi:hypothetical protein
MAENLAASLHKILTVSLGMNENLYEIILSDFTPIKTAYYVWKVRANGLRKRREQSERPLHALLAHSMLA